MAQPLPRSESDLSPYIQTAQNMGYIIGVIYRDNGKENGNYFNGLYRVEYEKDLPDKTVRYAWGSHVRCSRARSHLQNPLVRSLTKLPCLKGQISVPQKSSVEAKRSRGKNQQHNPCNKATQEIMSMWCPPTKGSFWLNAQKNSTISIFKIAQLVCHAFVL